MLDIDLDQSFWAQSVLFVQTRADAHPACEYCSWRQCHVGHLLEIEVPCTNCRFVRRFWRSSGVARLPRRARRAANRPSQWVRYRALNRACSRAHLSWRGRAVVPHTPNSPSSRRRCGSRCTQCEAESACEANRLLCRLCGGYRTCVISGDDIAHLAAHRIVAAGTTTAGTTRGSTMCETCGCNITAGNVHLTRDGHGQDGPHRRSAAESAGGE